jgi:hypothetical protein
VWARYALVGALIMLPLAAHANSQPHSGITPRITHTPLAVPSNLRRTTSPAVCAAHLAPIENAGSCASRMKLAQLIFVWDYPNPVNPGGNIGFQINRKGTDALDLFNGTTGWYLGLGQGYGNAGPGDCFSVLARTRNGASKSPNSNVACLPNPRPLNFRQTSDPAVCAAHLAPIESSSSCLSRINAGQHIFVWDYSFPLDASGTLGFTIFRANGTKALDVFNGETGWYMGSGTGYDNVAGGDCLYVVARWRSSPNDLSGHSNTSCVPRLRR